MRAHAMDTKIDAEQVERVLNCLAQRKQSQDLGDAASRLEELRPPWLRAATWDVLLDDLAAQRYRERVTRKPRLVRVSGTPAGRFRQAS